MNRLGKKRARAERFPWVWTRSALPPGRQGQRCRKTGVRRAGNVVGVEFMDGKVFIVAEGGLKRAER